VAAADGAAVRLGIEPSSPRPPALKARKVECPLLFLAAYDLTSGRELWQSTLKGIGGVKYSAYRNLVNMGLAGEAISIQGHESYGDYLEILDRKTGKRLAHRVFRKGFEAEGVPATKSG
jgi:hypothetical protein